MIQSMTGYGKATATFGDKKIYVEIKSLNSKAMDLSTRIAPLYREKEMEIRNLISKTLERGKVDVNLWIEKKRQKLQLPSTLHSCRITINKSRLFPKHATFRYRKTGLLPCFVCRMSLLV